MSRENVISNNSDATRKSERDESPSGSARRRTVEALRRVLAAGAVTSAAFAACGQEQIVCDPLPPPVQCPADVDHFFPEKMTSWDAAWFPPKGGRKLAIRLIVDAPGDRQATNFSMGDDVKVEGGTILLLNDAKPRKVPAGKRWPYIEAFIKPEEGKKAVNVTVPVRCGALAGTLHLELDIAQEPKEGRKIPVVVEDKPPKKK